MSKKILIISNIDMSLYKFRKELILEFINNKHDVYITSPFGNFIEYFTELGCKFIETKVDRRGKNILKDFALLKNYIKIIKEVKPDVVLTYTIKPNIYGGIACRITKTPYIANITGLGTAIENKSILQKLILLLMRFALKDVKCCFSQNEENKHFLLKHNIANRKIKLIPGSGVNLTDYKLLEYPNGQNIEFLFISRIMKEKGIEQYLEMAQYIKSKYPNTKFNILGFCEQKYEEKLKQMQDDGYIEYFGRQDDIIPFMKKSYCTIHPSYYPEGMSNVLLESAASGRPVITTDRSGCKEVIDNEINGYIVPVKDTEKLIEAVEKFINLPYEEKKNMGLAGRKKVEEEFDRNIVVKAYMEEIRKWQKQGESNLKSIKK